MTHQSITIINCHIIIPLYLFVQVPVKWMAPEAVLERLYTTASDVWSFGILCWEVFSFGTTPYPRMGVNDVILALAQGYRMPRPEDCPSDLFGSTL